MAPGADVQLEDLLEGGWRGEVAAANVGRDTDAAAGDGGRPRLADLDVLAAARTGALDDVRPRLAEAVRVLRAAGSRSIVGGDRD